MRFGKMTSRSPGLTGSFAEMRFQISRACSGTPKRSAREERLSPYMTV